MSWLRPAGRFGGEIEGEVPLSRWGTPGRMRNATAERIAGSCPRGRGACPPRPMSPSSWTATAAGRSPRPRSRSATAPAPRPPAGRWKPRPIRATAGSPCSPSPPRTAAAARGSLAIQALLRLYLRSETANLVKEACACGCSATTPASAGDGPRHPSAEAATAAGTRLNLNVALSKRRAGRDPRRRPRRRPAVAECRQSPEQIDEARFSALLYTAACRTPTSTTAPGRAAPVELHAVAGRLCGIRLPGVLWPDFGPSTSPPRSRKSRARTALRGAALSGLALPAPEPKRWRDLRKRFLSALVLGPTALACIWLGAESLDGAGRPAIGVLAGKGASLRPVDARRARHRGAGRRAWRRHHGGAEQSRAALVCLGLGWALTWWGGGRPARPAEAGQPAGWLAFGVLYIAWPDRADRAAPRQRGRPRQRPVLFLVVWARISAPTWPARARRAEARPLGLAEQDLDRRAGGSPAPWPSAPSPPSCSPRGGEPGGGGRAILGISAQAGDLLESWIKRASR